MRKHILMSLMATAFLSACATNDVSDKPKTNNDAKITKSSKINSSGKINTVKKSAAINAVSIAPLDAVIRHKNQGKAALFAAVGGGLAQTEVDDYMDQQVNDLQLRLQTEIERGEISIAKRPGDNALWISMISSTGFDNLSSVIKPGFLSTLSKIAPVLNQSSKTLLTVIGYTENVGPDAGNQRLAERRAQSVADYFISQNVNSLRLQSYGLSDPQGGPDTNTERENQLKRRVELWVQPVVAK